MSSSLVDIALGSKLDKRINCECGYGGDFVKLQIKIGKMIHQSSLVGIPEKFILEIGAIIAEWSHLEQRFDVAYLSRIVMEDACSGSMNNPRVKKIFDRFQDKAKELRDYFKKSDDIDIDEKKKWDDCLSEMISIKNKRDKLAHRSIGKKFIENDKIDIDSNSILIRGINWKDPTKNKFESINISELESLQKRMIIVGAILVELMSSQNYIPKQ